MSWMDLDDRLLDHPKFIRAAKQGGGEAIHLWLGLRQYVAQHLTDGFIPADMLDEVRGPSGRKRAAALEVLKNVGLVEEAPGGVALHDYLQWSKSRDQVLELKRIAGVRSALRASPELMALIKKRDGDHCRYCGVHVSWTDRRGPLGATYDHVTPISKGGTNDLDNIVVACRACNSKKQNHPDWQSRLLPVGEPRKLPVTSPLLSTPLHTGEISARAPEGQPAPDSDPDPKLTSCPLNLAERPETSIIVRDFVEKYSLSAEQIRDVVREFVSYWTIGGGMGRKHANWPKKLREHIRRRCEEPGAIQAPGALEHAARQPRRKRTTGEATALAEVISAPYHETYKVPDYLKD